MLRSTFNSALFGLLRAHHVEAIQGQGFAPCVKTWGTERLNYVHLPGGRLEEELRFSGQAIAKGWKISAALRRIS